MRTPCKYAHEARYDRYIWGEIVNVTVNECYAEKEPFECDEQCREQCNKYKPLHENKLEWIARRTNDGT